MNLVEFLRRQGEKLIPSGQDKRMASAHSITVRGNEWYDHESKEGGHAISFVQTYYGLTYQEAVKRLLDGDSSLWGTTWVADMSNGYVGIGYGEDGAAQQVPDDVKNAVEELSKKIVSGEITVETTR